jgi:hypothetical protein
MFFLYFFMRHVDRPIRVFGALATVCFGLAAVISFVLGVLWLTYRVPVVRVYSGWFTLVVALSLGGLQILLTGIVMEMIARLYYPGGEKVQYFIRQIWTAENLRSAPPPV